MSHSEILFINPPSFAVADVFRTSINPPLNIAYIIASLKTNGQKVKVLDLNLKSVMKYGYKRHNHMLGLWLSGIPESTYLNFVNRQIYQTISNNDFKIVGMNGDLYTVAFYCLREVKRYSSKIFSVVGGVVASFSYGTFLDKKQVDYVVIDEGEKSFVELANSLITGEATRNIPGIVYKIGGCYMKTNSRGPLSLEETVIPDYSCFDIKSYLKLNGNRLMVLSARGCRGRCKFCGMPRHIPIRTRSPKAIVDEIEILKMRYGVSTFTFFNSMMNITSKHIDSICNELMTRKIGIKFACYLKADRYLSTDSFKVLKAAGCYAVCFGIESGSQRILNAFCKDVQIKEAINLVRAAKKANLMVRCTFIWGWPGESWYDFFKTLRVYSKMRPDCVGFFEFRVSETSEFYCDIENYTDLFYEEAIRIAIIRHSFVSKMKQLLVFAVGMILKKHRS